MVGKGWILAVAGVCFGIQAFISRHLFWDSYMGLVAGRYIATNGIPTAEVLTSAAKPHWIDQQWLAHWLFYQAWTLAGYAGTALASALSVTLAFTILAALMVKRGVPGPRAFVWALAALGVALGGTVIRAQSFSLPLAALLLWAILADSERPTFRARLLLVLPLLVIWANLHGSVLLGAGLLAVYAVARSTAGAVDRAWRSSVLYAMTAVLALTTVVATPYGLGAIDYYRSLIDNQTVHLFILEWSPPELGNLYSVGFFALLVVTSLIVAYGFAARYRPPVVLLVGAAGLGILALTGVRFQVWFGLVATVLAADVLAHTRRPAPPFPTRVVSAGATAIGLFALVAAIVLVTTSDDDFERTLPRAAMASAASYAQREPGTRILPDELGSALLWEHPELLGRVAFDARLEQYPEETLLEWFQYLNGISPGWPAASDGYDILVASAVRRPDLVERLAALPGWSTLYSEPNGAAFVRTRP